MTPFQELCKNPKAFRELKEGLFLLAHGRMRQEEIADAVAVTLLRLVQQEKQGRVWDPARCTILEHAANTIDGARADVRRRERRKPTTAMPEGLEVTSPEASAEEQLAEHQQHALRSQFAEEVRKSLADSTKEGLTARILDQVRGGFEGTRKELSEVLGAPQDKIDLAYKRIAERAARLRKLMKGDT